MKRIEMIITKYQGKLYIEGKISRNREIAQRENQEANLWVLKHYPLRDVLDIETELAF